MKKSKVKMTLLKGSKADDLEMLIKMFRHMTGREPTQQEIEEAKKELQS